MSKNLSFWTACLFTLTTTFSACSDDEVVGSQPLPEQPAQLTELLTNYNTNISAYQAMRDGKAEIVDYTSNGSGNYKLQLSNQQIADAYTQAVADQEIPLLGIDEEGYWNYQLGGIVSSLTDLAGNPAPALSKARKGVFTPQIALGKDGCWQVSYNGYQWKRLSDKPAPALTGKTNANFSLYRATVLDENGSIITLESRIGQNTLRMLTRNNGSAKAWKKFLMATDDNTLLDYSYAGYNRGASAPNDGFMWGYKVCNVKQRMEQDKVTALEAFTRILDENRLIRKTNTSATNANAKIVIYFPAGEYVIHDGAGKNFPYEIYGGNFVIKGDGQQKTRLVMKTPNGDTEATHIPMITIKHTNSPNHAGNSPLLAKVKENAAKGSNSLAVSTTAGLTPGRWVQLRLRSGNEELIAKELGPIEPKATWTIMKQPFAIADNKGDENGVKVTEFHQIKSVSGNRVYFNEPIMHDVDVKYNDCDGWEIREYKYFENVGVEDLTFVGQAVTPYYHHGDNSMPGIEPWVYDEEYRPLSMARLVNSWVRNVDFESVSEALTISESANCSAYNIEIRGNRGHASVRAAGSTRLFLGNIRDVSKDAVANRFGTIGEGQWHGCGISKPSIGNVIWNSTWGSNACFESHSTQPRATLIDKCSGGLIYYHAGGSDYEAPAHLSDLTLWNLNVTGTTDERKRDYANGLSGDGFKWWINSDLWWKIYPPIVVGVHGRAVTFSKDKGQMTYEESTGIMVTPESLYAAQLEKRLGAVPAWLKALK